MIDELPPLIRMEVKTTRTEVFTFSDRDLEGVGPDGMLCVLLESRRLGGPRWVIVPRRLCSAGRIADAELAQLENPCHLTQEIQSGWSDWLMSEESMDAVLEGGLTEFPAKIRWLREQNLPRVNMSAGSLRAVRLGKCLGRLHRRVDEVAGGLGAQAEGRIHQNLIEDVIEHLGYRMIPNPVGVPDILAEM